MSPQEPAPLSLSAERFLTELLARVGAQPGVHDWLAALVESPSAVTAAAGTGVDLATLGRDARARLGRGDTGAPVSRDELAVRAGRQAAAEGRPVATMADLMAVLLAAASTTSTPPEPPTRVEVEVPPPPEVAPAPLSIGAERLLTSLFADAGSAALADVLTALVDRHADALSSAGADRVGLEELASTPRAAKATGLAGPPVTRDEIAERAGQWAASQRREVATADDVAAAIRSAAQAPSEDVVPTEPDGATAHDEGPIRSPSAEPRAAPAQRAIRVFVSSTFRDMKAERDELVKRVFPRLRRLCEERDVVWAEVDLRWGITDEQKAEGRVLPICLAEIRGCRPFFLGLLGERYGWVPEAIDPELLDAQPWLAEHPGSSVTELEFLYGALDDPAIATQGFFYLRSPRYLDRLAADERAQFVEGAEPAEGEAFGAQEAEHRAAERRRRLDALKEKIRASGLPVHEDYPDPESLGQLVLEDLTASIDRLYPAGSRQDPLDHDASEHEMYARSRVHVYVGREDYFRQLDDHVAGSNPPLAVLGESGSGKSALLANWALRHRAANPDGFLLTHFIGATPQSADWVAMLRRLLGELARYFGIAVDIPDEANALRAALASTLYQVAARGRVVLVLDALNQLDDREGAPDLVWLPPDLPANVRLITSTLPGRPLDEIRERGWTTLEVQPLERDERARLLADYLAPRTLSPSRVDRLVDAPQTANPLYLRALLEELRVWGEHFRLDEQIDRYLGAATVKELYGKILARYEEDYERDRPGLVGEAMSLLWAGRRGLSETELLDLLGAGGAPLPRAVWSPLALVAEQSLVNHAGLITFSHDYLRAAVADRYLPSDTEKRLARIRIADYFEGGPLGTRKVSELPWQLARAHEWTRLYDLLSEPQFFSAAWATDEFEVKARWADLETGSSLRMADAYRPVVDDPSRYDDDLVWQVERLLAETGHPDEAMTLLRAEEARARASDAPERLEGVLGNQGVLLFERGELDAAMALYREQEAICRRLGDEAGVTRSLGNQANVLFRRGDLEGSMALHQQEEQLCRQRGDRLALQQSLGNQATILSEQGDLAGAMALHREEERICRELGNPDELQASLGNQAILLRRQGDLDGALSLLEEKERICRQLGNRAGLVRALANRAEVLRDLGRLDAALAVNQESVQISRELGDRPDLALLLGSRAEILKGLGDLDGATSCHEEAVAVCRELGNPRGLERSLGALARLLQDRGDLDRALEVYEEDVRLCRELGDADLLQAALNNQAVVLKRRGAFDEAMVLHQEVERICRANQDRSGTARSLANQGLVLSRKGDPEGAMALLQESEQICRELQEMEGVASALANQAAVRSREGRSDEAQALLRAAHRVASEHGLADLVATIEPQLEAGSPDAGGPDAGSPSTSSSPAPEPVEGLSEPSRLDAVMKNPAGDLVLGIFASGEWGGDPRLLAALEAKLDNYVAFARSQECTDRFGAAPRRILVLTVHDPTPEVEELLRNLAASSGVPIDVEKRPGGPGLLG